MLFELCSQSGGVCELQVNYGSGSNQNGTDPPTAFYEKYSVCHHCLKQLLFEQLVLFKTG
jgi:hypothetical protein